MALKKETYEQLQKQKQISISKKRKWQTQIQTLLGKRETKKMVNWRILG